jgi:diaminopimelate decarboxylase
VLGVKETTNKTFVIVDAAMNDLIRPMLYGAHHPVVPVSHRDVQPTKIVDIVGPVCETTDTLASARSMPLPREGDLLAILHTGAYGSSMASNYNSRRRAAEALIPLDGPPMVIRARESWDDLMRGESLPP